MKKIKYILLAGIFSVLAFFPSCIDEDINKDPNGSYNPKDWKPQWALYSSMSDAQMNPHIAERIFVLTWKSGAHFDRGGSFALGQDNNTYMTDYLSLDFGVKWLRDANRAVEIAQSKIDDGSADVTPYYKNALQMARIWRVYILSELTDGFGPIPLTGFEGRNVPFNSVEEVYDYMLEELADAESKLDSGIDMADYGTISDPMFKTDVTKWQKYANSMRMRLAMRMSEIAPAKAQANFEAAAQRPFIQNLSDMAQVAENLDGGWGNYTGVMSRGWNAQVISPTFNNLVVGLGGQEFPVADSLKNRLADPESYLGLYLPKFLPLTTNDPCAGYVFDSLPKTIDPRAALMYNIPGYKDNKGIYPSTAYGDNGLPNKDNDWKLPAIFGDETDSLTINMMYTWSTNVGGVWDKKGTYSAGYNGSSRYYNMPSLSNAYRTSTNSRVFFGPWESYFLLAEAALKGWSVPGTAQSNYESGIQASFDHHGLGAYAAAYITSQDYNRVGTSVAFNHTAEATNYTIKRKVYNFTTKQMEMETTTYEYPKNSVYQGGAVNNDQLTKIITQKYIAQVPWLPLEAWSDHRRLGLPFFENQAVEVDYNAQTRVPLTVATSKVCSWEYYPKRFRYPAVFDVTDKSGYDQAVQLLNGPDKTTTKLWWAQ